MWSLVKILSSSSPLRIPLSLSLSLKKKKSNEIWITWILNTGAKAVKILEYVEDLFDSESGKDFLDVIQEAQTIKKLSNFYSYLF